MSLNFLCLKDLHNEIQCNTIQYNTIQYDTIQYNTIQYNTIHTIQYNTIQYNTIQYNTIQYNTIQYNAIQYNTIQYKYNTIQYNAIQYNTIHTIQYNTIQHSRNIGCRNIWIVIHLLHVDPTFWKQSRLAFPQQCHCQGSAWARSEPFFATLATTRTSIAPLAFWQKVTQYSALTFPASYQWCVGIAQTVGGEPWHQEPTSKQRCPSSIDAQLVFDRFNSLLVGVTYTAQLPIPLCPSHFHRTTKSQQPKQRQEHTSATTSAAKPPPKLPTTTVTTIKTTRQQEHS